MISSYKGAENMYRGCRSPKAGKPLPGQWRLFKEKNTFTICLPLSGWHRVPAYLSVATITPNNTLTMLLSKDELLNYSNTIVVMLGKLTPITCQRFATGKYRIGKGKRQTWSLGDGDRRTWFLLTKDNSQQYYKGIKFDLMTGLCLNPEPDESVEPVPEQRKVWLRELKRFKRGLKSRAKVGALTAHIQKANAIRVENNKLSWHERKRLAIDWEQDTWRKKLVWCMKNETYPPEILMAFVQSVETSWGHHSITQELVLETVDNMFTKHSEMLRREYGVFGKTLHKKK
jgi:hypothetical protein